MNVLIYYATLSNEIVPVRFAAPTPFEGVTAPDQIGSYLSDLADRYAIDTLIYVTIEPPEAALDDGIVLASVMYDRATDATSDELDESIPIATLSDYNELHRLVAARFSSIFRIDTGWGSWTPENRGEPGTFDAYIDDVFAGSDLTASVAVPTGNHVVLLLQERPFGLQILAEQTIVVRDGEANIVPFTIPELTDLERSAFERLEQTARNRWDEDSEIASTRISGALELLKKSDASEALSALAKRFAVLEANLISGEAPERLPGDALLTIRDPSEFNEAEDDALVRETEFSEELQVAPSTDESLAQDAETQGSESSDTGTDGTDLPGAESGDTEPETTSIPSQKFCP